MASTTGMNITLALQGQAAVTEGLKGVSSTVANTTNTNVASFDKTRAGVESISRELVKLEGYAKAYLGLSQLGAMAASVVQTADAFIGLQARLKLATTSQLEFNTANAALYAIAQKNGVPLAESLGLYSKLAPALREMGASQAQVLTMTDLVGKSLRLSGAGAAESAATMLQFSQALGSGVLRGDEFNSLMENSPRLMKAVADGLGRPIGELRSMAEQGKLTADIVVNALLAQKTKIEAEYSSLPLTVSAAWTKLGNAVTQEVGRLDKAGGGLSGSLAQSLGGVADNLGRVEQAFKSAGVALASFGVLKASAALAGYVTELQAVRAAAIAVAEAEVARVNMTYTASAAERAAAASALTQATATGTLAGAVGTATAAMRAFVVANPFLLIAAGIGTAAFAATKFFEDATQGLNNFQARVKSATIAQLSQERAALNTEMVGMQNSVLKGFYEKDIRQNEDRIRLLDAQIVSRQATASAPASAIAPRANLTDYLANGQTKAAQLKQALGEEATAYNLLIAQAKGKKSEIEQIESAHQVRLAAIAEKFKDKKGARRTSLVGGDGDKASLDAELRVLQDGLARAGRAYDAALADRTISLRDYYLAKTTLDQQAIDAEIARTQASLVVQRRIAQSGSQEAVKAKGEVAKLEADLVILNNRRTDVEVANAHKAAVAEKSLADELQKVRDELAQRAGGGGDTRATLEAQFADLKARLGADAAGVALVDKLIDVKLAEANLARLEQDWQRTTTRMRDARDAVAVQQQAGLLTQSQAQQQLVKIQQQAVAEMEKLLPAMESAAKAIGPDAVARIAAWKNELGRTRLVVDEVAVAINGAAQNSFATLFSDIASGAMTAQAAFSKMAQSILAEIAKIAAQKMAAQLFANLGGDSGGLGGFISGLMRGFAGGGYVTGAGTATSDSIPARLSHGEFVMQSSAVQRFGVGFMNALNGGLALPRSASSTLAFAGGGLVPDSPTTAGSNGQAVRIVNVIDPAIAGDYLNSSAGEKVILNVLSRNAGLMKHILA